LSESEKADFFKSIDGYVAPNIRGESFGIILAEAMAGGAPIIASDIKAFTDLLNNGKYGVNFENESPRSLARVAINLLKNEELKSALRERGLEYARTFDWESVASQILDVYEVAIAGVAASL